MKTFRSKPLFLLAISLALNLVCNAQNREGKLDVQNLEAVPEGNYLVTLELNGKQERMNIKVEKNRARCVNSSHPAWKGAEGRFERYAKGAGMFEARFRVGQDWATQLWIFRPDGVAAIREAPDRGEIQSAVPVKGDSIELPKGKR